MYFLIDYIIKSYVVFQTLTDICLQWDTMLYLVIGVYQVRMCIRLAVMCMVQHCSLVDNTESSKCRPVPIQQNGVLHTIIRVDAAEAINLCIMYLYLQQCTILYIELIYQTKYIK